MLTREEILARKQAGRTEVYALADGTGEVEIRGLTRDETLVLRDAETLAEKDNILIHFGLVNPAMTIAEVAEWAAGETAGTLSALSQRIGEISGMSEGAGKSGVPRAGTKRRR